jgi:flavin reductase (DIM6/NTAB) family NADH-FMN oxidoreductase RutF
MNVNYDELITISGTEHLWEQFFTVFPLVIIGTREENGEYNLAPKHLAIPLSWQNHFGFVCTAAHRTYQNIKGNGEFTVSYPRPEQIVFTSLTASPRCEDEHKPIVDVLPTFKASEVDSLFIKDAYLYLECKLDRIIDDFGINSLITGTIIKAHVDKDAMRHSDHDDNDVIHRNPLLAYIYPGRFTKIEDSQALPFPDGFKR